MSRSLIALFFALVLVQWTTSWQAEAAVVRPLSGAITLERGLAEPASFWARPYPSGYSGWRGCRHRVKVETPRGWRWRRVCV